MIGTEEDARKRLREAGCSKTVVPRYGFLCVYDRLRGGETVRDEFYYKGAAPSQARARAEFKDGFIRIVELRPLSRAEWDRAHNAKAVK
jgi:hypothetical protein